MTTTPTVTKIRIVEDGYPRQFMVTVCGREVPMRASDLLDRRRFGMRTIAVIRQLIDPPTPAELQRLLDEANRELGAAG